MKKIFLKKIIIGFVFVVAVIIALPVNAYAKTTNWTNGAGTENFTAVGNWSNGVPVTGDTVQFLDSTKLLPTLNQPNTGVFALVLRDDVGIGWPWTLDTPYTYITTFMGTGNWSYSSVTIGSATKHGDDIDINKDGQPGSTIAIWATSQVETASVANATVTVKSGGVFYGEIDNALGQTLKVENGGTFSVNGNPGRTYRFPLNNVIPLQLAGTLTNGGDSILDAAGPITGTGDSTIDWNHSFFIYGGLNANGHTITHANTTGANLIIDQPGIMDLGTTNNTVAGLTVQIANNNIHLNKNWTMDGMTVGLGTGTLIADSDLTIDGSNATAITSTGATIIGTGHAVTVKNLGNQIVDCYDCIDGGGNGANVTFIYTDATLSNLAISAGTLTPEFASGTTSYTDSVANSVSSVTVTPTRNQANATIKVNDVAVTSGSASGDISLNVGDNTITTVVTAQDGTTTDTYTITVTRAVSSDATLSSLAINSGALTPTFASGTTSYTDSVANSVTSVTVAPTRSQANATITVNGTTVVSGAPSGQIALNVGDNTITTVVTAQDTTTTETYTITVNRAAAVISSGGGGGIPQTILPTLVVKDNATQIIELKQQLIVLITQVLQLLQAKLALMLAAQ